MINRRQIRKNLRVLKTVYYRKFKLELVDNGGLKWKYEWRVTALGSVTRRAMRMWSNTYGYLITDVMQDNTSSLDSRSALERGKIRINECLHPYWRSR